MSMRNPSQEFYVGREVEKVNLEKGNSKVCLRSFSRSDSDKMFYDANNFYYKESNIFNNTRKFRMKKVDEFSNVDGKNLELLGINSSLVSYLKYRCYCFFICLNFKSKINIIVQEVRKKTFEFLSIEKEIQTKLHIVSKL